MAFDCFLKINGIPGESTDGKHAEWIEVLSFSHHVSQSGAGPWSGEGASRRCDHDDFTIEKVVDKASPKLALSCCKGNAISEVRLEMCRATGDKRKYMEIIMSFVVVSNYVFKGKLMGPQTLPVEEVSFNYGKIEWLYTEADHRTGKPKGDVKAHWDVSANKGG